MAKKAAPPMKKSMPKSMPSKAMPMKEKGMHDMGGGHMMKDSEMKKMMGKKK